MKRNAGSFLRGKRNKLVLLSTGGAGIYFGLTIGFVLYAVFPNWIGYGWGVAAFMTALAGIYIAIRIVDRPSSRWNLKNLRKGEDAEIRIGQVIEYAIIAEFCAVAHGVTEIAKGGDIDHLVATPVRVWVIETKNRKVPEQKFSLVLDRIANNVDTVRKWAQRLALTETPVRGCLVLAFENKIGKDTYEGSNENGGKENITVYTEDSLDKLFREIREEARYSRSLDERIVKEIRRLGRDVERQSKQR